MAGRPEGETEMTLLDTIHAIEAVAASQPSVRTIVRNDVFKLNACPDVRYGAFAWTQGQHTGEAEGDLRTFAFSLFYVDRLTEGESNREEVQSEAVDVLGNIIAALAEYGVETDGPYSVTTFNQRFSDLCAGAFVTVAFTVPATLTCPVDYPGALGDFNNDFNPDFFIRRPTKRI